MPSSSFATTIIGRFPLLSNAVFFGFSFLASWIIMDPILQRGLGRSWDTPFVPDIVASAILQLPIAYIIQTILQLDITNINQARTNIDQAAVNTGIIHKYKPKTSAEDILNDPKTLESNVAFFAQAVESSVAGAQTSNHFTEERSLRHLSLYLVLVIGLVINPLFFFGTTPDFWFGVILCAFSSSSFMMQISVPYYYVYDISTICRQAGINAKFNALTRDVRL